MGIPGLVLSYWTGIAYIPQVDVPVRPSAGSSTSSPDLDSN